MPSEADTRGHSGEEGREGCHSGVDGRDFWMFGIGAPGSGATREALSDPVRRPARAREDFSEEVRAFQPRAPFVLDQDTFLKCLRTAKRGAAGGPSGMTIEHIRSLLESPNDSSLEEGFEASLQETWCGGWSAGQWPNSWGRHSNKPLPPSKYALSTHAGCECVCLMCSRAS